ncbi:phospholipase A2-like [Eleutherodactylus coqui]|uniref:phospholipase A2-like n=1 Tax=Eleutherodactylus coqui TaxID=57060 RepID=UPI00346314E9
MASFLLFLLGTLTVAGSQAGLVKFGRMVQQATKRPALWSFSFYGCYCGLGGQGWPMDDIDWCCQKHDCCYDVLMKAGCAPLSQDYNYSHINGVITCDDEDLNGCARVCCECDREISHCFRENNHRYRKEHNLNFSRKKCWGKPLPCLGGPPPRSHTTYTNTGDGEPDQSKGSY